ncbi:MAG: DUF4465 domain-containing protein [Rhodocyclaceae bacterium]|nr:DUF4465 domain-containing protein [Rhodocyclaceae bacterium]
MIRTILATTLLSSCFLSTGASAALSTFEDLGLPGPESHYVPDTTTSGAFPFVSGAATFNHDYTNFGFPGCCWSGWVYSNHTDTSSAGFDNQYSAFAGSGHGGSANYAVAFVGPSDITLTAPTTVGGAYFTNTTYAALSMRDGDGFAKKFGGASGNDPDYFKLTISGFDGAQDKGQVDFFLADFRFDDHGQDYIVKDWTFVDLSALGQVSRLSFQLTSSDSGPWGMNTPAYFAMDNLTTVPEPAQSALLLVGLALVGFCARGRLGRGAV